MSIRSRIFIGAVAIICTIVTIARATPIVGLLFGNILASGSTKEEISQHVCGFRYPTASTEATRIGTVTIGGPPS
jgi:hypothetical protein